MELTRRHSPRQLAALIKQLRMRGLDPKPTIDAWNNAIDTSTINAPSDPLHHIYVQTHRASMLAATVSLGSDHPQSHSRPGAICKLCPPQKMCLYQTDTNPGDVVNRTLLHLIDHGWKPAAR